MILTRLINRVKAPLPAADRNMEYIAGIMLAVLLILTAVFYAVAPAQVPIHFNFNGIADGWSEKIFYWQAAIVFVIFMAVIFVTAYFPEYTIRIPICRRRLTEHQKHLAGRMYRVLNVSLAVLWFVIQLSASSEFLGIGSTVLACILFVTVAIIVLPMLYFTIKIFLIHLDK